MVGLGEDIMPVCTTQAALNSASQQTVQPKMYSLRPQVVNELSLMRSWQVV